MSYITRYVTLLVRVLLGCGGGTSPCLMDLFKSKIRYIRKIYIHSLIQSFAIYRSSLCEFVFSC